MDAQRRARGKGPTKKGEQLSYVNALVTAVWLLAGEGKRATKKGGKKK